MKLSQAIDAIDSAFAAQVARNFQIMVLAKIEEKNANGAGEKQFSNGIDIAIASHSAAIRIIQSKLKDGDAQ